MKKKVMATMLSAMCLATGAMNGLMMTNAAEIQNDENNSVVIGDINNDGKFNIADVVTFQKWVLGSKDISIANWKAADLISDEKLDIFDLTLMKQILIKELEGTPELNDPEIREILFGYSSTDSSSQSPMSSMRIAMKCKAFCPTDEKLTVDAAMLGLYAPDGYDENGFIYNYSIASYEQWNMIENSKIVVNGKNSIYEKEYLGKDREIFNVGREYDNYDSYYHENSTLDFHNYAVGDSGCIIFTLKAIYLNEDGTLPEHPSTTGCSQNLYFYVGEDGVGISGTSVEDAEESYKTKGKEIVPPTDIYTGKWNGKDISFDLYKALKNSESDTIPVLVQFKDTGIDEFVYKDRTVHEYSMDFSNEDIDKMGQLLEQGDLLKYGESLYTTGTPEGITWTKAMYDFRIDFFGEELLSKYITDGEFLKEQLQNDLKEMKASYQAVLDEAVEAFYQTEIEKTASILEEKNIRTERIEGTNEMVIYVTAEEFDEITLDNASYYGLAFSEPIIF